MTIGAVAMRSRLNSRSSRSWMISRCSRPRKPQRKPKPSAARGLHLVGEARVVEAQPAHRGAQVLEIGGVDREEAAEHHRLRRLEAGQRLGGRAPLVGDRVADAGVGDLLDLRGDEADLARAELVDRPSSSGGRRRCGRPRSRRPRPSCGCAGPSCSAPSMTRTSTTTPR